MLAVQLRVFEDVWVRPASWEAAPRWTRPHSINAPVEQLCFVHAEVTVHAIIAPAPVRVDLVGEHMREQVQDALAIPRVRPQPRQRGWMYTSQRWPRAVRERPSNSPSPSAIPDGRLSEKKKKKKNLSASFTTSRECSAVRGT